MADNPGDEDSLVSSGHPKFKKLQNAWMDTLIKETTNRGSISDAELAIKSKDLALREAELELFKKRGKKRFGDF